MNLIIEDEEEKERYQIKETKNRVILSNAFKVLKK